MGTIRRIKKDLKELREANIHGFRQIVDEKNLTSLEGLILPDYPPYNKGAFRIEITFPEEYPFKPPKVVFKTKIYHPNISENGNFCVPNVDHGKWSPAIKMVDVIQDIFPLVNDVERFMVPPDSNHGFRPLLTAEYRRDPELFFKNAEDHTLKFAEKRPPDQELWTPSQSWKGPTAQGRI